MAWKKSGVATIALSLAIMWLLSSLAHSASKVYKCLDSAGKVVFSDSACGDRVEVIEYKHPETYLEKHKREMKEAADKRAVEDVAREKERAEWAAFTAEQNRKRVAMCEARRAQKGLFIGMRKSDLYNDSNWQFPDDVSKTTTAGGVTEYWVYNCDGYGSVRLFLRNGELTSIHN